MRTVKLKTGLFVSYSVLLACATVARAEQQVRAPIEVDKPVVKPEDAANPLKRLVRNMQAIQGRIEKKELGSETRKLQTQVVDDLDRLINQLKKQSSSQKNSDQAPPQKQSAQKHSDSANQKPKAAPPNQKKQGKKTQPGLQEGKRKKENSASETTGKTERGELTSAELSRRQTLLKEVWGHLPPNVRQKILNDIYNEKYLPKYSELVRKYFEALAEKQQ